MIEPEYSATYMIEQSTPDVRATDRWARDLIVKIERERSEAGLILGHDRASLRDANAELARLRHENERLCGRLDDVARLHGIISTLGAEAKRNDALIARWEAMHADNVGALEDAGVRRNDDDDIANGIATLARDRDDGLAEWSKVRELVAAVVQSHDAPGGCRGPVGYTAMAHLAEWLATSDPEMGS